MVPPSGEPTTGESAESLAPRAISDVAPASADTAANAATTSAFIPSGSGSGSSPTDVTQPVTYVVQRWNSPTPDAEIPPTTSTGFTPPVPSASPTTPIAPPAVPPTSPYGSSDTVSFNAIPAAPSSSDNPAGTPSGGTYVPYSSDAARQLQAGPPKRTWLVPTIVAAALVLLLLVGVSGFLIINGKSTPTTSAVPNNPSSNPDVAPGTGATGQNDCKGLAGTDENTSLKMIICQSNDEQIKAWHDLDTTILSGTRTGQALQENIDAVHELMDKNMYALPANKSIVFGDISITGDTATVKTVEVWSVAFFNKDDNKQISMQGPDTLQELYHFVKQDGKWLIQTVDIVQPTDPTPTVAPGSKA